MLSHSKKKVDTQHLQRRDIIHFSPIKIKLIPHPQVLISDKELLEQTDIQPGVILITVMPLSPKGRDRKAFSNKHGMPLYLFGISEGNFYYTYQ